MFIIIPGWLITLATFPGVVMHEIAHKFMCDILQVPVYHVSYFSLDSTRAGYVSHHKTDNVTHDFLIGFAPLVINTFFCMIFTLPFFSSMGIEYHPRTVIINTFLCWVGISIGMNACPSTQDVQNVIDTMQTNEISFFIKFLCYFIKFINWFRCAPLDFVYAILVSFILPCIFFK